MGRKKKTETNRWIVLRNGKRFLVTGEDGKYWFCGETQFLKAIHGEPIEEPEPAPNPEPEPEDAETDGVHVQ